ncbi:hypothetical protein INR49_013973 [Caranx melampygus]|nr:hypothetical protein INR49_013973 [Caranx melampygus]
MTRVLRGFISTSATVTDTLRVIPEPFTSPKAIASAAAATPSLLHIFLIIFKIVMAAEMSCLTGVDEDDKDADPEINVLSLLQEPVRMAQESASCTDTFGKPSLKQNSVLDVMSSADMLSPVGLGNGPSSHQPTQAHELNSICTEKEEEKSITPLKTVQEIDTAGIWGFDVDSPENSLDNFSSASGDLHWDPHKEFMQFLWENHGDSPGEEPKEEVPHTNSQRRRKRKMDMVVMVDPSEDLYPDLSHKSSEELSDAEGQVDSIPVRKRYRWSRTLILFCDLVFQGPLSVQEDWIKHLQRHIMNTSVPHTGLGMVEVTSLPIDPPTLKTDQDSSLTATHAAS